MSQADADTRAALGRGGLQRLKHLLLQLWNFEGHQDERRPEHEAVQRELTLNDPDRHRTGRLGEADTPRDAE